MSENVQRKEKSSKSKKMYSADRVIGNGSFGIVYQATCNTTSETVAIKKVLQDRRYKNRELQIMKIVKHPNIVEVKDCFYSKGRGRDVYLNLVMEYVPETVYQMIRNHTKARQTIPYLYTKLYAFQLCRAISYCHSMGICHRDIKPQNLLLNPKTHVVKLCDFGSAKILVEGEANVAYICSRYYRSPELIFESSDYTTAIDTWSLGCVIAECYLGSPLFQGSSSLDQLVEIIKVLGCPSKEEILAMNPQYDRCQFPQVQPVSWERIFENITYENEPMTPDSIELIKSFLNFHPEQRITPFEALKHSFFDELRREDLRLPNNQPLPDIFDFTEDEIKKCNELDLRIIPDHILSQRVTN